MIVEEEVESLLLNGKKIDIRAYVFFGKVIYVYPRKNRPENITTNISQGGKGDPKILKKLPAYLVDKIEYTALRASRAIGVNLAGIDVMISQDLKSLYVLDLNVFPGLPKIRTFNLPRSAIKRLEGMKKINFEKAETEKVTSVTAQRSRYLESVKEIYA